MLGQGPSSVAECFPSMFKDLASILRTTEETKDGTPAYLCLGLAVGCTLETRVLECCSPDGAAVLRGWKTF